MTLAKAKTKTNETFIVQASLMIVTYDRKNMFKVQATGLVRDKRSSVICRNIYSKEKRFMALTPGPNGKKTFYIGNLRTF
jgi:hypothetical protein